MRVWSMARLRGWLVKTKPEFKVKIAEAYVPVWQTQIGAGINKEDKDLKVEVDKVVQKASPRGENKTDPHEVGAVRQLIGPPIVTVIGGLFLSLG